MKRVKDLSFFQLFGSKQSFSNLMGEEELDGDGWIWGGRFGMVAYSMGGKSDVYFCISIFTALQSVGFAFGNRGMASRSGTLSTASMAAGSNTRLHCCLSNCLGHLSEQSRMPWVSS